MMIFQKHDKFISKGGDILKILEVTERGIKFRLNGSRIVLTNTNWNSINEFFKNYAKKLTDIQYKECLDEYWNMVENNSEIKIDRID